MPAPKLFLDVNIILDVAFERGQDHSAAAKVFSLIEEGHARGFISAASYTVLYYLIAKHADAKKAHQFLNNLRKLVHTVDLTDIIIQQALLTGTDLEDTVQEISAVICQADYLLTRDKKGFKKSTIPVLTATEYIAGTAE